MSLKSKSANRNPYIAVRYEFGATQEPLVGKVNLFTITLGVVVLRESLM